MRTVIVVCACFTCVSQARRVQTKASNPAHDRDLDIAALHHTDALNEVQPNLANLKNAASGPLLLSEVALELRHVEGRAQLVKLMASQKSQAQAKRDAEQMKALGMPSDLLKFEYYAPGVLTGHPVRTSAHRADVREKVEEVRRPERKVVFNGDDTNNHVHGGEPVYFPRFNKRVISGLQSPRRGGASVMADAGSEPGLFKLGSIALLFGACLWIILTQVTSTSVGCACTSQQVSLGIMTPERLRRVLLAAGAITTTGLAGAAIFVRRLMERMYASIQLSPATQRQLVEENLDANPLYRVVPALRGKFAWRQLGTFPTPVHRFTCSLPVSGETGEDIEFWVKREDLSSAQYGGNKVRTLQYQLASCEARVEDCSKKGIDPPRFFVLGTGGSNQIVATKLHAAGIGLPSDSVEGFCLQDPKEMDNTLNYLSSLSLPGKQEVYGKGVGKLLSALMGWTGGEEVPGIFMPGGNNPTGVLGQVGGALELAEQIVKGDLPDPDCIVVALGSMCTVTGIVLGVALARDMGLPAFRKPGFCIHAQPVHPALIHAHRLSGVLKSHSFPMAVGRGVKEAAAAIIAKGGPDVLDAALRVMQNELVLSTDASITGTYGAHSSVSKDAKALYDEHVHSPLGAMGLWLCGHFTAKSFALLLKLLRKDEGRKKVMLFWQTKSAVQPLGPRDEWRAFQEQCNSSSELKKWGVLGGITGHVSRIGSGEFGKGSQAQGPEQYRPLMTPVLHRSAL